jgi:ribosomal protein L29
MSESIKQMSNAQLIKRIKELEKEVERLKQKLIMSWGSCD